ncbi:MAG: hypothetical protein FJX74_10230 [Armatimonadetes bacterium]|nr:hypothetical protein [Armatimonadota bacterium]
MPNALRLALEAALARGRLVTSGGPFIRRGFYEMAGYVGLDPYLAGTTVRGALRAPELELAALGYPLLKDVRLAVEGAWDAGMAQTAPRDPLWNHRSVRSGMATAAHWGAERDLFSVTVEHWSAMPFEEQLLTEGVAAQMIKELLPALLDEASLLEVEYVVACGRHADGTVRVVYHGRERPAPEVLEAAESEHGFKAWRVATFAPAPAEESSATPDGIAWAAGVSTRRETLGRAGERGPSDDRYPVAQIRVSWGDRRPPGGPSLSLAADLDTGCPWACLPLERMSAALGLERVQGLCEAMGEQWHLGQPWLCWNVKPDDLAFEVRGWGGWMEFAPPDRTVYTTLGWGAHHALSQVRPEREALAGRCIWRGAVKLTLESSGTDWGAAPPVTY